MLRTNVIGIDLAKDEFQICNISRQKIKELLAKAKLSLVALEGYATCHYWVDTLSPSAMKCV